MPYRFRNLPEDHDLQAIAVAVRIVVKAMHEGNNNYTEIAERAGALLERTVNDGHIRAFMSRAGGAVRRSNATLEALYDYIYFGKETFPEPVQAVMRTHWDVLFPNDEDTDARRKISMHVGRALTEWLEVGAPDVNRTANKFCGRYVMLRKSMQSSDIIVRSRVTIERISGRLDHLTISHVHHDKWKRERTSRGPFFPVSTNLYGVLNVESREAVEFLAIRNPVQEDFGILLGFLTSINADRKLLSAQVCLTREGENVNALEPRFDKAKYREDEFISGLVSYLDDEHARTIPNPPEDPLWNRG